MTLIPRVLAKLQWDVDGTKAGVKEDTGSSQQRRPVNRREKIEIGRQDQGGGYPDHP